MPVNYVLLCVLAGIIGLVLSGFTGWHVYLATQGQTTIESLEKTRYLTPMRRSMQNQISRERNYVGTEDVSHSPRLTDQIREFHANALPGVTRPEEGGDDRDIALSAEASLRRNYSDMEVQRERDRYAAYLDEQDSESLPNAFDHGWKRNLKHVFGESRLLWFLPVCNTSGDGWNWETSHKWRQARENMARERQAREGQNQIFDHQGSDWAQRAPTVDFRNNSSSQSHSIPSGTPKSAVSMRMLQPRGISQPTSHHQEQLENNDEESEDNKDNSKQSLLRSQAQYESGQWNDVPEEMSVPRSPSRGPVRTRSPRPPRSYPNR